MLPVALALLTSAGGRALDGPDRPRNLRCEYLSAPLGIDDAAPRLSWEVNDSRRGARQSGYHVLVADSPAGLRRDRGGCWDSGKVESDRSIHVTYAGAPLRSRARYHWKVRTWDGAGVASPWSAPASWEMGLLADDDWRADWIAMSDDDTGPRLGQWIWHPEQGADQRIYLEKAFALAGKAVSADLRLTADNHFRLFINGAEIGAHDAWESLPTFDVASALRADAENLIAIEARNEGGPPEGEGQLALTSWREAPSSAGRP